MTNKNPPIKETQGHRKLQQYVDDLKRNKHLLAKIKKIRDILKRPANKDKWDEREKKYDEILEKKKQLDELTKEIVSATKLEVDEIIYGIAEEYGLDNDMVGNLFLMTEFMGNEKDPIGEIFDFCRITDDYDETIYPLSPDFPFPAPLPIEMDRDRQSHIRAFPVSINIHKLATKRDVLDFVEKRWPFIESYLDTYRNGQKIRFRMRKHPREITDFIWENRNFSAKEIKKELDKVHPKNGLVYYEIGKIISIEKRRRSKKIIVGQ